MEELQSTGVLDREILEDARGKARRILKAADGQIAQADREWEERTLAALTELEKRAAARLENVRRECAARLPLDRRRARLKKIDALLHAAGRAWLESLPRARFLALLEAEFALRSGELEPSPAGSGGGPPLGAEMETAYCGMEDAEIEALMRKYAAGRAWVPVKIPDAGDGFPAFTVDSGAVRISVSVAEALETLLEEKRGELAARLLGEEALDVR
ncbi:MAG: ATPase [Spirochaetaceae bacterium]|nr:ATPase [Spirochaetaceae bacterium]